MVSKAFQELNENKNEKTNTISIFWF